MRTMINAYYSQTGKLQYIYSIYITWKKTHYDQTYIIIPFYCPKYLEKKKVCVAAFVCSLNGGNNRSDSNIFIHTHWKEQKIVHVKKCDPLLFILLMARPAAVCPLSFLDHFIPLLQRRVIRCRGRISHCIFDIYSLHVF